MKRSGPAAIVNTWLMMIIPRRESEPPSTFPGIRLTYLPIYRISGADSREKVAERRPVYRLRRNPKVLAALAHSSPAGGGTVPDRSVQRKRLGRYVGRLLGLAVDSVEGANVVSPLPGLAGLARTAFPRLTLGARYGAPHCGWFWGSPVVRSLLALRARKGRLRTGDCGSRVGIRTID